MSAAERSRPTQPSLAAASNLPPAYPQRAPWGTAQSLRAWQAEALELYLQQNSQDFLAVATPGAGKTTFALRVAAELLAARVIRRISVVAPTEHLKTQWADAAARVGISLDPNFRNAQVHHGAGYQGVALTYAQVAANPNLHRSRTEAEPTLVILDEVHHGGDALSWGESIRIAFNDATKRLSLTGTPFRSDTAPIPFIRYVEEADGVRRSQADYTYGYANALRDRVVRPVLFMAYSGQMRWRTRMGDEVEARLGELLTKDMMNQAWRTALSPEGEWIPQVLKAANARLSEVRRNVADAGGLVIATDHETARAYAELLRHISGEEPTVILSDDTGASKKIDEFSAATSRWMVAVRMVSEGVDIPRLSVGVYATGTATPLFFAQAVGRFVRARTRGESATIFLPSVQHLLQLASELELERDHALDRVVDSSELLLLDDGTLELAQQEDSASDDLMLPGFAALEAQASFDKVLFDGNEFGVDLSDDDADFLGLPGLLDADQMASLLRDKQAAHVRKSPGAGRGGPNVQGHPPVMDHRKLAELRKELNALVAAWSRRSGTPHGIIHTDLRRHSGGAEVATANQDHLEARIAQVRRWFARG